MVKIRNIKEYPLFLCGAEPSKVEALHKFTGEMRDRLISDYPVQDLLLNRGYEPEGERPESYLDLNCGIWNRRKVALHLTYLKGIQDLAEAPAVVSISRPRIIKSEKDEKITVKTAGGHDPERIEWLQEQWMNSPEIGKAVRNYRHALESSLDEYNMQLVLNLVNHARGCFIPTEWGAEYALQERMREVCDSKAYTVLDSAYYNFGNRLFRQAGDFWQVLDKDDFGKFFRLTAEEEKKAFMRQ
jgi:hypothetical protein